jgi:hypothetical protein
VRAPVRTATSKGNVFRVDSTVLLFEFEMYLNVPGPEVLTFFVHRHHSRTGTSALLFTTNVTVNGTGLGPMWYSSGPIALPLVAGNHYNLGVAWPGSLTYHYTVSATGTPVSFGAWMRATTRATRRPRPGSSPAATRHSTTSG